jgi:lipopolysaccharide/colanic/teichoic acid biosynthesis glycosyltransferase
LKILVIHQYYLGPGEPGGSRFNELARLWREAGHDVTVIAGTFNYATGVVAAGTRGWITRRTEDGISVLRCHVPSTYNRGYAGRMWAFFGFTLTATLAALRTARPDVIIATSPPLTTAVTGWLAAIRHGVPWVFEIRDLWPESAVTTGVLSERGLLTRLLYGLERFACARATKINVLTPAFALDLKRRGLAANEKICFVPNGADLDAFVPQPPDNECRRQRGWTGKFVALYAGAHGRANALMQLVDAADALLPEPDVLIVSVGDGPERGACERAARERGVTNIQFIGAVSKAQIPSVVNAADVGLAVLQNNPTFKTVYPNKVFDYMACARPVIVAIDGVARKLVCEDAEAGLYATPEDGAALAAAILRLRDDPALALRLGQNGRVWVSQNANRRSLAQRYLKVLTDVIELPVSAPRTLYRSYGKRILDVTASVLLLVALSPVMAMVAVLIALGVGKPVLFRQQRPGRNGVPFTILKFRTMSDDRDDFGAHLPDAVRLTAIGRFLRDSSLDELPELWNVLRGDMSLVGPRPLLVQYLSRYTPEQRRRHQLQPGITGLAQVSGRNALTWERKFELDVEYVDGCSFLLDASILIRTGVALVRRDGINQPGHATAAEFMGSNRS